VTARVSVPLEPGATERDVTEGASVKLGAEVTTNAMVVVSASVPEVPVMVTVAVPAAAVLLLVSVSTLVDVVGLGAKEAVTPVGNPDTASVTLPVNPFTSVTVMVSVSLLPAAIESDAAEGVSVKLGAAVTVNGKVMVAPAEPEFAETVTEEVPTAAVVLAVSVSTLVEVVGLALNAAVTPLGSPDAESVMLPVPPVTVMVQVLLPPCTTSGVGDPPQDDVIVMPGVVVTVSEIVVVALSAPEVPVMVIAVVAAVAVLATVSVSTLVEVAGSVANAAVTPVGRPDAARVTEPANGLTSVIVIVSVPLAPLAIDRVAADGFSVKLPVLLTVRAIVVLAVRLPEVPVMVTVEVPTVAVALAAKVTTLLPVVGLVPNVAVTPLGNPDAARLTLPVNGLTSVTVIVSVALAPWVTASVAAEGLSVKPPVAPPPHVTPFTAKAVGAALVTPFHVPLNPIPLRLPPAGMLPL
jgi:hypothetical protein